jgi:hypothetical protein
MINELVEEALNEKLSYNAKMVFRDGGIYIHLRMSTGLYIKYFKKVNREARGSDIASFDLNSDRVNMVIIDKQGVIRDARTEWYPEVNRSGYQKKARALRLDALGRLLKYAYNHNVSRVLFEDLDRIKRNNKKNSKTDNRKKNSFP